MLRFGLFVAAVASCFALTGCGTKYSEVKGVVKLDGSPVEGATVTLVSDDGKKSYAGVTDASGNFAILSGDKPGAPAGSYKVLVIKNKSVAGLGEGGMVAGGDSYMKMMKGNQKEAEKESTKGMKGSIGPAPVSMAPQGAAAVKSDLPGTYGAAASTPLTVTVPTNGPVTLELKSKP